MTSTCRPLAVIAVLAVGLVAGCDRPTATWQGAPAARQPSATGPATPTPSSSPSSALTEATARAKIKNALPPATALDQLDFPARLVEEKPNTVPLTDSCNTPVAADKDPLHVSAGRSWRKDSANVIVSTSVHAYSPSPATAVVANAKQSAERCKTFTTSAGTTTHLGAFDVKLPAGTESAYAECERFVLAGRSNPVNGCMAFVARGQFVLWIGVVSASAFEAATLIDEVLPIAAAPFVATT